MLLDTSGADASQPFNLTNPDFTHNPHTTTLHLSQEQEQFNTLLEEIKSVSEEAERLRRQLHDAQHETHRANQQL
jgi:hypothetical protein